MSPLRQLVGSPSIWVADSSDPDAALRVLPIVKGRENTNSTSLLLLLKWVKCVRTQVQKKGYRLSTQFRSGCNQNQLYSKERSHCRYYYSHKCQHQLQSGRIFIYRERLGVDMVLTSSECSLACFGPMARPKQGLCLKREKCCLHRQDFEAGNHPVISKAKFNILAFYFIEWNFILAGSKSI